MSVTLFGEAQVQTAIVGTPNRKLGISHNIQLPVLHPGHVIVKNFAVGLNPIDAKWLDIPTYPSAIAGFDFAGTVLSIAPNVQSPVPIQIGDRVCGFVHGMNSLEPNVGAFAQFVSAPGHLLLKIPDSMSFEDAATLPSGLGTIGVALFPSMGLEGRPSKQTGNREQVLVYGGSTCCGIYALQILRLSGYEPIAVCSSKNHELAQNYGAFACFDYHSNNCIAEIKTYTKNSLRYVLDCISDGVSTTFCYSCIGRVKGRYTALVPYPLKLLTRSTVKADWVLVVELIGKPSAWSTTLPEKPPISKAKEFGLEWFSEIQELVDARRIRPPPKEVISCGWDGIINGLARLQYKTISGKKLVAHIEQV